MSSGKITFTESHVIDIYCGFVVTAAKLELGERGRVKVIFTLHELLLVLKLAVEFSKH